MPTVSGSGGAKTIPVSSGDKLTVIDFGVFGTDPTLAAPAELDTLQFLGAGMTASNLLLTQAGANVLVTFEGLPGTQVTLSNVTVEQLENITAAGNFQFFGESSVTDSVDVWSAGQTGSIVDQANITTFLNDLGNTVYRWDGGNETINGQGGDDRLSGFGGTDILRGAAGSDVLDGGSGADRMVGGDGNDTYGIDEAGDQVVETNGTGGIDTVVSSLYHENYQLGENIENLTAALHVWVNGTGNGLANVMIGNEYGNMFEGGSGDDSLFGNAHNDKLLGGLGNDLLDGGVDDDTLDGGTGDDVMNGGRGDDIYLVDSLGDKVIETVRGGTGGGWDQVTSSVDFVLGANVDDLSLTGSAIIGTGNDIHNVIGGNAQANLISGGAGDDLLGGGGGADNMYGGSRDDVLDAGTDADVMVGGSGNDDYYVENVADKVTESANQGIDRVFSTVSFTLGKNVEFLQLYGGANASGTGNELDNTIYGNEGSNFLSGGAGNDVIVGSTWGFGSGKDVLHGDAGNDILYMQSLDIVTVDGGDGVDTLQFDVLYGDIDITGPVSGRLSNIDVLQLTLDFNGRPQNLILDKAAVDAMNGADGAFGQKTVLLKGESADSLTFDDSGWTKAGSETDPFGQTGSYGKYVSGDTTLYVEDAVGVIGIA